MRVPPPRQRPMVPVVPVQQRGLDLQQKSSTLVLLLLQCHGALTINADKERHTACAV